MHGKLVLTHLDAAHPFDLKVYDEYIIHTRDKWEKLKIRAQIKCNLVQPGDNSNFRQPQHQQNLFEQQL